MTADDELSDVERDPHDGSPVLRFVKGSEIEACIDSKHRGTDHIFRPVFIGQDKEFLNLTVDDAHRLLEFLKDAVVYLEGKVTWMHQ
jgi:hypothetical protein